MDPFSAVVALIAGTAISLWQNNEENKNIEDAYQRQKKEEQDLREFNSPKAQADRLRAAGLNPIDFMGNPWQQSTAVTIPVRRTADLSGISEGIANIGKAFSEYDMNELKKSLALSEYDNQAIESMQEFALNEEKLKLLQTPIGKSYLQEVFGPNAKFVEDIIKMLLKIFATKTIGGGKGNDNKQGRLF